MQSLEEFNRDRVEQVNALCGQAKKANGIACPKCGGELFDDDPKMVFASSPPKKSVSCGNCNYSGYRVA